MTFEQTMHTMLSQVEKEFLKMLFQIKTSKRGWINPADEPENWQGLCGDFHFENNHLILWASSQTMWQKLHNLPNTSFQVNGSIPETIEVRYCYIHK